MISSPKNGDFVSPAQALSARTSPRAGASPVKPSRANLLDEWYLLSLKHHRPAFRCSSVYRSVSNTALGLVAGVATGTLTSAITLEGRELESGYATTYHAFSRGKWELNSVHKGTLEAALPLYERDSPITMALDATTVEKTSPNLFGTRWCHDAAGPKGIGVQLLWGLPLSHLALTIPTRTNGRATAVTIGLDLIPGKGKKKRRKKAVDETTPPPKRGRPTKEEAAKRSLEPKLLKATEVGLIQIQRARIDLDDLGAKDRLLVVATDGAYINKTLLPNLPDRVSLVGRARRDAILYAPPAQPGELHGERLPTPDEIAKDRSYPRSCGEFYYGGDKRDLEYKVLPHPVIWRFDKYNAGVLRLILLMPIPYMGPSGKLQYNAYYYVLTNDLTSPLEMLIQAVLDRWQIEVLHRELKHDIGLGEDQCRNPVSMARVPSMVAAAYALVKVAALRLFGPIRSDRDFLQLPKWRQHLERSRANRRRKKKCDPPVPRPSVQDLLARLRRELLFKWVGGKSRRG